ncbi:SemiSWEET family sugar transporter [Miltoncostaea oceani]|jgi:MtN3 and saliva related transmembrane protein|uniref:SemiSWEET family sugar transporter n=1 Tax=Miltoncostaea oceani TaxID=2843216 RepID=UPI001C3D30A5|nr:SemiSWEET family transporter [Miltoncostaea oceani]
MNALAATVSVYGVIMALAPGLQVRRMRQERSARGVSIGYAVVLWIGFCIWLAYGLAEGDTPLILANMVNVLVTGVMIGFAVRVRRAEQARLAVVGAGA